MALALRGLYAPGMERRAPARGDLGRVGLALLVFTVVQLDVGLSEPWSASTAARWAVGAALAAALLTQGARPALGAGLLCGAVAVQVVLLDPSVTFGHFIAFFAAMTTAARRAALGPAVAALLSMAATISLVGVRAADPEFELAFPLFVFGCAWALGRVVRSHAAQAAALADLGRRLAVEQNRVREIAVMEERERIAGDLHDVLAHSMTSIVVQAGAADEVLTEDPSAARDLLRRSRRRAVRDWWSCAGSCACSTTSVGR